MYNLNWFSECNWYITLLPLFLLWRHQLTRAGCSSDGNPLHLHPTFLLFPNHPKDYMVLNFKETRNLFVT